MILGFREAKTVSEVSDGIRRIMELAMPIVGEVATSAPTTDTLPVGYLQFYDDGTNRRIYANLNGTMYYWALTAA